MDKRINAAAAAFPKLEPLIQGHLQRSSGLSCTDEELFYEESTRDIYIALTFSDSSQLIVHAPHHGAPTVTDTATVLELDLEDITHIIPEAVIQVLHDQYTQQQLKSALHASILLCECAPDYRLDGFAARQRQKTHKV